MDDHKGIDLAIRAVAKSDPSIRLDIYGDGVKRAHLEALTQAQGVADRVQFCGWMASHEELLDTLAQYRGYVFPTLAEANGIVMQEAMMIGLPVIATRWGGPEKLADDEAAWYVDPVSEGAMIDAIAHAMTCLAMEPEKADRLGRNARTIAETRFSWENVSRSWIDAAYGSDFFEPLHADKANTHRISSASS
jgi:glycosyltransferase involved in cell wall biosynthesis